jgi:hypothetical protein
MPSKRKWLAKGVQKVNHSKTKENTWYILINSSYLYVSKKFNSGGKTSSVHRFKPTHTFDGVLVIVQTGYVFGAGLGWHS